MNDRKLIECLYGEFGKGRTGLGERKMPEKGWRKAGLGDIWGIIEDKFYAHLVHGPLLGLDANHIFDGWQALRWVEQEVYEEFGEIKLRPDFWELRRYKKLNSIPINFAGSEGRTLLDWYVVEKATRNERIKDYIGKVIENTKERVKREFRLRFKELEDEKKAEAEKEFEEKYKEREKERRDFLTEMVIRGAYNERFIEGASMALAEETLTGVMDAYKSMFFKAGKSEEEVKNIFAMIQPGDLVKMYTNMVRSSFEAPADYFIRTPISPYKHMITSKEKEVGETRVTQTLPQGPEGGYGERKPFWERHPKLYKLLYGPTPWDVVGIRRD